MAATCSEKVGTGNSFYLYFTHLPTNSKHTVYKQEVNKATGSICKGIMYSKPVIIERKKT